LYYDYQLRYDGSRVNSRNVVYIKCNSDNGHCPTQYLRNDTLSGTFRESLCYMFTGQIVVGGAAVPHLTQLPVEVLMRIMKFCVQLLGRKRPLAFQLL